MNVSASVSRGVDVGMNVEDIGVRVSFPVYVLWTDVPCIVVVSTGYPKLGAT